MTQKQWDAHRGHIDDHIDWPATKKEIMAACQGMDVDRQVLEDIKMNVPDGSTKYTKAEIYKMLVV